MPPFIEMLLGLKPLPPRTDLQTLEIPPVDRDSSGSAGDYTRQIMLLQSSDRAETNDLVRRLSAIGAKACVVPSFEEAQLALRENGVDYGAILIPTQFESFMLEITLRALLSDASDEGLSFVSVGPEPNRDQRKRLRKAGVRIALWNPVHDTILRFQINRALNPSASDFEQRSNRRVPTDLRCRVTSGGRQKDAIVYNLSTTGAFLETPRASMTGAQVEIDLRFDTHLMKTKASVVYANVPGNLQRPGLPLGMGVAFSSLDKVDQKALNKYLDRLVGELIV